VLLACPFGVDKRPTNQLEHGLQTCLCVPEFCDLVVVEGLLPALTKLKNASTKFFICCSKADIC
jgi:hypothetical protein